MSLAQARDIDSVLLIFSHDNFDEDINQLVTTIDFCKVRILCWRLAWVLETNSMDLGVLLLAHGPKCRHWVATLLSVWLMGFQTLMWCVKTPCLPFTMLFFLFLLKNVLPFCYFPMSAFCYFICCISIQMPIDCFPGIDTISSLKVFHNSHFVICIIPLLFWNGRFSVLHPALPVTVGGNRIMSIEKVSSLELAFYQTWLMDESFYMPSLDPQDNFFYDEMITSSGSKGLIVCHSWSFKEKMLI